MFASLLDFVGGSSASTSNATGRPRRAAAPVFEPLEPRTLFSGGAAPEAYAPDANVAGRSIAQWMANFWTKVFQTRVHAADGTTILNPMLSDTAPSSQGNAGSVFYLFSSFFGGNHTHTATVPSETPLFVPVLPIEFSNFDTTTGNVAGGALPGTNTAAQLSNFAAQAALPALGRGGEVHLSVDGQSLRHAGSYREIAPTFRYVLPETDNVDQYFFNQENLKGRVSPAEADGFYVMLRPLSVGRHVIDFGGTTPGGPLGPLNVDVTCTIDVVPKDTALVVNSTSATRTAAATPAAIDAVVGGLKKKHLVEEVLA
jgi:hypothetical protein